MTDSTRLDTSKLHQLHDAAHAEAEALRREAMADFWRGTDQLLGNAWTSAERSARRLAQRLQRRAASAAGAGAKLPCAG